MKVSIVVIFSVASLISAATQQLQRQASLDVVTKLKNAIPGLDRSQNVVIQGVAEAKQKASIALKNFYFSVLFIKSESLKVALEEEQQVLQFGETIDQWCWENNLYLLEGAMGWVGNDFSSCVNKVDKRLTDIVGKIYARFQEGEVAIRKYNLLAVFERKNIINSPHLVSDAIDELQFDGNDFELDFGEIVNELRNDLNAQLPVYDACLKDSLAELRNKLDNMKMYTKQCLENI